MIAADGIETGTGTVAAVDWTAIAANANSRPTTFAVSAACPCASRREETCDRACCIRVVDGGAMSSHIGVPERLALVARLQGEAQKTWVG